MVEPDPASAKVPQGSRSSSNGLEIGRNGTQLGHEVDTRHPLHDGVTTRPALKARRWHSDVYVPAASDRAWAGIPTA